MIRALLLTLFFCGAACTGYKQAVRIGKAELRFRHATLPSGARVVLEEARGSGTVSVVLMVGAGASADPEGKEGLAHLVEHLGFRSRPNGNVTQMQAYELAGVSYINASTHFDDTRIELVAPARLAQSAIALATQQFDHPLEHIDPRVFAVERDVVLSEQIEGAEQGLEGEAAAVLQRALFPEGHRFARPLSGTMRSISSLALEDAQAWVAEQYLPSQMTLVVVGDFDAAMMEPQLLAALPPSWREPVAKPPPTVRSFGIPPTPPPRAPEVPAVHAASDRSALLLAWSLPASWALTAPPEFLVHTEQHWLRVGAKPNPEIGPASCGLLPSPEVSFLFCRVKLLTGLHADASLNELSSRLEHLWDRDLRLKQLSAAEGYLHLLFREETLLSRATDRAEAMHFMGDPFALNKRFDQMRQLDADALTRLAREYLTRDRMRAVLIDPLDASATTVYRSGGVGESPLEVTVPIEALREEAEGPNLTGLRTYTLSNGLTVVVVPRPALPVAAVVLAVPGGEAGGPKGAALLAQLFTTSEASAGRLAGDTRVVHDPDVTMVSFTGANGNLEALLDNAHAWVEVTRGRQLVELFQKLIDTGFEKIELDADDLANTRFTDAVYRGSRASPTLERDVFGKLKVDDAEAWRQAALQPARSVVVVSGDVDPEAARMFAEKHLGGWRGEEASLSLPPPISLDQKPTVVQVNGRPRSAVVKLSLGCLLPPTEPKLSLAPAVLATLLKTRFERLWRAELGVSYGVNTRVEVSEVASALFLESKLDPRRLTTVLRTLKQQWDQLELPEQEVAMARWQTARARSAAGSTSAGMAAFLAGPAVRTHDPLGAVAREHALADLPAALLQQQFDVCKGTTVLRLDGDEALIREALHDAGL